MKCREAVEEELRAAAAFAHLHDLLKVAALDAAAAAREQLESKLEAARSNEKRLRLALAAAGVLRLRRPGRPTRRAATRAAAAARLGTCAGREGGGRRRARGAGGRARRPRAPPARPPPSAVHAREPLAADFGRR